MHGIVIGVALGLAATPSAAVAGVAVGRRIARFARIGRR